MGRGFAECWFREFLLRHACQMSEEAKACALGHAGTFWKQSTREFCNQDACAAQNGRRNVELWKRGADHITEERHIPQPCGSTYGDNAATVGHGH